jgi:hypothetical protein
MKIRGLIAAASAAAALSCTVAFALPAMASAHTSTHTLKFTAVVTKEITFSPASAGRAENDLNGKGKIIGVDVVYIAFTSATTASGNFTLDTSGGLLYGTLTITSSPAFHGKVTGGTGAFKGAAGTILGKSLNTSDTRTAITITYTT